MNVTAKTNTVKTISSLSTSLRDRRAADERERHIIALMGIASIEAGKAQLHGGFIWIDRDDLEAIGVQAVIEAVDSFDPSLGVKLKTHVIGRVRWAIARALQDYRNAASKNAEGHQWIGIDAHPSGKNDDTSTLTLAEVLSDSRCNFEEVILLKSMIESLPQPHRDIMMMHVYDGMTHDEIAEKIGGYDKSRITVRLKEARTYLDSILNGDTDRANAVIGKPTTRRAWRGERAKTGVKAGI